MKDKAIYENSQIRDDIDEISYIEERFIASEPAMKYRRLGNLERPAKQYEKLLSDQCSFA